MFFRSNSGVRSPARKFAVKKLSTAKLCVKSPRGLGHENIRRPRNSNPTSAEMHLYIQTLMRGELGLIKYTRSWHHFQKFEDETNVFFSDLGQSLKKSGHFNGLFSNHLSLGIETIFQHFILNAQIKDNSICLGYCLCLGFKM